MSGAGFRRRQWSAKPPVSVLIADFQNRTGDPVFNGVVEQALALGIEEASFITAYPRRDALRVAAALRPGAPLDEQTARLVALREGVAVIVLVVRSSPRTAATGSRRGHCVVATIRPNSSTR